MSRIYNLRDGNFQISLRAPTRIPPVLDFSRVNPRNRTIFRTAAVGAQCSIGQNGLTAALRRCGARVVALQALAWATGWLVPAPSGPMDLGANLQ